MSWNEDKWLIWFVQVCHDTALLCRQMDSHQRGHIWIRWESSPSISPMWECSNPHQKLFSLWLWFLAADEMRNGWRETSDHVYFALTLGRQQHRYEDKRHCHTLSSPLQRFPLHKGSNYSRKSSGLFSRNLKATKRLNTECCPLRNLGYRSITEHKIFHHGRGQSFIPDFSFSKSPRIWNFLPRLIHLDPLLCPWTDGGSEKGGKVAKHFITQPVQGSGVGWGSLEEEC